MLDATTLYHRRMFADLELNLQSIMGVARQQQQQPAVATQHQIGNVQQQSMTPPRDHVVVETTEHQPEGKNVTSSENNNVVASVHAHQHESPSKTTRFSVSPVALPADPAHAAAAASSATASSRPSKLSLSGDGAEGMFETFMQHRKGIYITDRERYVTLHDQ